MASAKGGLRRLSAWHHRRRASAHTPPPICDDVRAWCGSHPGTSYNAIIEAHRVKRPPPNTIEPTVHEVFDQYLDVEVPEQGLALVPGAKLASNGLVFLPDDLLVGESVTHMMQFRPLILADEPAYTQPLPERARHMPGTYYSLVIGNYPNYWHWLHDVMARLALVLPLLPAKTRFIVPADLRSFHRESLATFGIDASRCVAYANDELWQCEQLAFGVPYLKGAMHSERTLRALSDHCLNVFDAADRTRAERIYVTRRNEQHWRTTNETEVESLLHPLGFKTYDLAAMSFADQVRLFARAEIVVGAGACLANALFAPPGAVVLNILEPVRPRGVQLAASAALDHRYWFFFADAVPNPDSPIGVSDLHVPLDKLRTSLEAALSG